MMVELGDVPVQSLVPDSLKVRLPPPHYPTQRNETRIDESTALLLLH